MAEKRSKLMDVKRPNLYRDLFPYSEFPGVKFDGVVVPCDFRRRNDGMD